MRVYAGDDSRDVEAGRARRGHAGPIAAEYGHGYR